MTRTVPIFLLLLVVACNGDDGEEEEDPCGPKTGKVVNVVDGDTVDLESGVRIRYMLADTPETPDDCFGDEATTYNAQLVLNREVELEYDVECEDMFDRTLAYVSVGGSMVNRLLVERGYACVLHIPPNGEQYVAEFRALQDAAEANARGLWGACDSSAPDFPSACE